MHVKNENGKLAELAQQLQQSATDMRHVIWELTECEKRKEQTIRKTNLQVCKIRRQAVRRSVSLSQEF